MIFFILFFLQQKYTELKNDLVRTEGHLLKEMGFICHVEHPHKFISNYLATLDAPPEMRQEAWNLANDRYHVVLSSERVLTFTKGLKVRYCFEIDDTILFISVCFIL